MDGTSWDSAVPNLSGRLTPIDFRRLFRGGYANVYQSTLEGRLVSIPDTHLWCFVNILYREQVAVKALCAIGSLRSMRRVSLTFPARHSYSLSG
jgi:hypothetical protein